MPCRAQSLRKMHFGFLCCILMFTLPYGNTTSSNNVRIAYENELKKDVQLIKAECGELCDTSIKGERQTHRGKNKDILLFI